MSTFIKVTNKDIYNKIEQIDARLTLFGEQNAKEHNTIKSISKKGMIIATGAIALSIMVLGFLINHMGG